MTITASPIAGDGAGRAHRPDGDRRDRPGLAELDAAGQQRRREHHLVQRVPRHVASGSETLLTSGGCSGLGAVTSCTDTGLTAGQAYYYKVTAVNAIGEGPQSNEATATPTGSGLPAGAAARQPRLRERQLQPRAVDGDLDPHAPSSVINRQLHSNRRTAEPGTPGSTAGARPPPTRCRQTVTLPSGCTTYNFSFWLHINTAETTTTTAYDTLKVQVLNSSGTVLGDPGHLLQPQPQHRLRPAHLQPGAYAGQTVTLKFTGAEDFEYQTSFVLDDTAVNVS